MADFRFQSLKSWKIDNIDLTEQVTLSIFSDFRSILYIDRILQSKDQITSHKENMYRALFLRVWAGNFYHFVVNASVNIAAEHHRLVCCSLIGADGVKVMLILDCYIRNPMCLNFRGRYSEKLSSTENENIRFNGTEWINIFQSDISRFRKF